MATTLRFGWEALAEIGIEPQDNYGRPVPSANFQAFSHLKNAVININENLTRDSSIGSGTGRNAQTTSKGMHEVTGSISFWLPDDLDSTALDVWLLKLGLDAFNVAHSGTAWVIPNTGTSVYASNELHSFNLEIGNNKTSNIVSHHILGCMVNNTNIHVERNAKVDFKLDFFAKMDYLDQTSFTNGSATQSTARPFTWSNCVIEYGDDNSTTPRNDFTMLDINFNNGITANADIAESNFWIEKMDATTGWAGSTDATIATSTTAVKEGTNSLSVAKTGTTVTACSMQKTISATDLSNKVCYLWVYIADAATLTAIDVSAAANNHVKFGVGGVVDYAQYNMGTGLTTLWNLIRMDIGATADATGGTGGDKTAIDTIAVVFKSDATGDTWAANKVLVDFLRAETPRAPSNMIVGQQMISGSFGVNMTTTSGMEFYQELADDTGDPVEVSATADSKEILLIIQNLANKSTQNIRIRLRDVQIGEIPQEINPEKVQEMAIPFTAQYHHTTITTPDTSAPTNWDDQS